MSNIAKFYFAAVAETIVQESLLKSWLTEGAPWTGGAGSYSNGN
jgi:hypothetical protein